MPTRELDVENLGHDKDWEGHCAAVTCPSCGKVYIVTSAQLDFGLRECPNCGRSTAQCYGTRLSGGSVSITWRRPGEGKASGFKTILGMICLALGSVGVVLGITLSTVLLVAQVIEGGFRAIGLVVAIFILAGGLILAGVQLRS
ncbi:MAG: hypothetical protein ABSA12_13440 [Verrucomicrobiia bacterium]|jgi:hypothetical protein